MRRIFIDSNIYLGFYNGVMENSISLFEEFVQLVDDGKVKLVLTQQTVNEINRNKISCRHKAWQLSKELGNRLMSTTKDLKSSDFEIVSIESYKEKMKDFSTKLIKQIESYVEEGGKVDQLIYRLISLSEVIQTTPEILKKAELRVKLGNPPRKGSSENSSLGDAVNWEILLENIKDDLIIVSNDKDFFDKDWDDKLELNLLLQNEWKDQVKKKILALENFAKLMEEIAKDNPKIKKSSIKRALQEERAIYVEGKEKEEEKFSFGNFDLNDYPNLKRKILEDLERKGFSGYQQTLSEQYMPSKREMGNIEEQDQYPSA